MFLQNKLRSVLMLVERGEAGAVQRLLQNFKKNFMFSTFFQHIFLYSSGNAKFCKIHKLLVQLKSRKLLWNDEPENETTRMQNGLY